VEIPEDLRRPAGAGILPAAVADLERHAFKRDKGFLVKLALFLVVGVVFGIFVFIKMTSPEVGSCVADGFGGVTGEQQGPEGGGAPAGD